MQCLTKKVGGLAYLFKGALTREECANISAIAERKGRVDTTTEINRDALVHQRRTKFADYNLSERIYNKIKDSFEAHAKHSYVATDTMITYVVYQEGGACPLHRDSKVENNIGKREYITVIVYLNDFTGGRTYFIDARSGHKHYVSAGAGDIMVFHGTQLPHGCDAVIGTKRILIFGIETP